MEKYDLFNKFSLFDRPNILIKQCICIHQKNIYTRVERIVELSCDGKQWNKAEWNEVYAF